MKKQDKNALMVLKYGKRRYDGGSEVQQIERIERKQALAQLRALELQTETMEKPENAELPEKSSEPVATATLGMDADLRPPVVLKLVPPLPAISEADKNTRRYRVVEALIIGPLALSVGMVGLLLTGLALFVFGRAGNQTLVEQAVDIRSQCMLALRKGFLDTLTTPTRVFKAFQRVVK